MPKRNQVIHSIIAKNTSHLYINNVDVVKQYYYQCCRDGEYKNCNKPRLSSMKSIESKKVQRS